MATAQDLMLEQGYKSGDPVRMKAALAAGYVPPGGLSGTGTPAPGVTPVLGSGGTPAALPPGKSSPILDFANSLNQAVELAKEHRNTSSVGMMEPFRGTVAASDFNSILGNLNAASDKSSDAIVKTATDLSKSDIITATDDSGTVHGIDKNTGKVVWSTPGVGNRQGSNSADVLVHTGNYTYTRQQYADDSDELEKSRGADTYVDPTVYDKLYNEWVRKGGKITDFITQFPPDKYVNPDNDWLPTFLRPKAASSNPFK